jgi:hypothetical protein
VGSHGVGDGCVAFIDKLEEFEEAPGFVERWRKEVKS